MLAHEIGHEKKNHVKKGLAVSLAMSLVGFWILSLLLPYLPLYQAFGFHAARLPCHPDPPCILLGPLHVLPPAPFLPLVPAGMNTRRTGSPSRGSAPPRA